MIASQLTAHVEASERGTVQTALAVIAPLVWTWFAAHSTDVLFTVKLLFLRKTFTVADAKPILVMLFGQPPIVLATGFAS